MGIYFILQKFLLIASQKRPSKQFGLMIFKKLSVKLMFKIRKWLKKKNFTFPREINLGMKWINNWFVKNNRNGWDLINKSTDVLVNRKWQPIAV